MVGRTPLFGVLVGAVAVTIVATVLEACSTSNRPAQPAFGVLAGSCDSDRLDAERRAGIEFVALDLAWDRYQPARGVVDQGYVAGIRYRVAACRRAGVSIILGIGLQYPPDWVRSLPSAGYVDQTGSTPGSGVVDFVFSAAVRDAAMEYFRRIAADIPLADVAAIRVGTNGTGELGYPGPDEGGSGWHSYWAFNTAAQTGQGLASGMKPAPMPGWRPGSATWRGSPVEAAQVVRWFTWYTESLVHTIDWQTAALREVGFTGQFHLPVAGRGALPSDLRAAVAGLLDGRHNPDGALERGLHYPSQFRLVADVDRRLRAQLPGRGIDVDFTGLDDVTAVRARRTDPHQAGCRPDDVARVVTDPAAEAWPAQRWTIATARLNGLGVLGENPGPPAAPFTGGAADSDGLADQLVHAIAYARACDLHTFLFAFEDDLFDGGSGVSLDNYARQINEGNGGMFG
jgi:hypothetical protein